MKNRKEKTIKYLGELYHDEPKRNDLDYFDQMYEAMVANDGPLLEWEDSLETMAADMMYLNGARNNLENELDEDNVEAKAEKLYKNFIREDMREEILGWWEDLKQYEAIDTDPGWITELKESKESK